MRDRIQRDLATESGRFVASQLGDERVGSLMTSGGEKKSNVPDEPEREKFRREVGHERGFRFLEELA
jgi:hypothetical protein